MFKLLIAHHDGESQVIDYEGKFFDCVARHQPVIGSKLEDVIDEPFQFPSNGVWLAEGRVKKMGVDDYRHEVSYYMDGTFKKIGEETTISI